MSTREASAGKSITVSEIAITGVCIALTFVATGFINIRLPIAANGGLVHLGNVPLFLAAIIFGKRTGALAGSFGMALFDLMGGWVLWAPFTFVIVGLMGFTVGAITENHKGFRWNALAIAAACVIKIVGYYIAEGFIYGNWIAPVTSIPGNLVQIGVAAVLIMVVWPKVTDKIPGSLIAIIVTTLIVYFAKLPVNTIGSVYGELSSSFPTPHMPAISFGLIQKMFSPAFTIAILAGIESLLSAVVSDGMIGDTHKSNAELIGQGVGNIFSGIFGGIPATGAIARTAANVRNGGRTPIAGIVHCVTLTVILLALMPLAALIPMTTLAAVLLVVAANMADWTSFFHLCKTAPKSDIIVMVATFFLTVFFDLVVAIEVGVVLASMLFMKRMAETADVTAWKYTDEPDMTPGEAEKLREIPHTIRVFEISGPLFFAAADEILRINSDRSTKVVVIRMRSVPAIDASAMRSLRDLEKRAKKKHITLIFSHVNEQPMSVMKKDGFVDDIGEKYFLPNIVAALDYAESLVK